MAKRKTKKHDPMMDVAEMKAAMGRKPMPMMRDMMTKAKKSRKRKGK